MPVGKVIATQFYATTDMGRYQAVAPEEIAKYVKSKNAFARPKVGKVKVESRENSQEAVFRALQTTDYGLQSTVLVTGSLYLVGEVRTMWNIARFDN